MHMKTAMGQTSQQPVCTHQVKALRNLEAQKEDIDKIDNIDSHTCLS